MSTIGRSIGIGTFFLTVLSFTTCYATGVDDTLKTVRDSASSLLTDARCAEVRERNIPEITCFLSFPDTVPNFFYEADSGKKQVTIKLLNTRMGGMTQNGRIDTVRLGPITSMTVREEIQNKNEAVKSLTPEWYYVTIVTISCYTAIRRQNDLAVSQMENAITLSFPWPEKASAQKKYYFLTARQRRPVLAISLIGVAVAGLAGGGYYAYKHYYLPSQEETSRPLEPVLPEHPSP